MEQGEIGIRVAGLTGGIAAGKSTVAAMFRELGCPLMDADQLSRDIMEDPRVLAQVVDAFGEGVLGDGGLLDRKALGSIVFSDAVARRQLEAITHPAIATAARRGFEDLRQQGHSLVMYEAALLVETGRHGEMDLLLVVVADEETRIQRLMRRSELDREEAVARLRAQLPQEEKAALAHHVIDNSGTLEQTRAQVVSAWQEISREETG